MYEYLLRDCYTLFAELDLATLKSVPADRVCNNNDLTLSIIYWCWIIHFCDQSSQVRPINFHDFELAIHQSRSSVSTDLIKGLEEWNTKYGVSA